MEKKNKNALILKHAGCLTAFTDFLMIFFPNFSHSLSCMNIT